MYALLQVGREVLIVNGRGRGLVATIVRINESDYTCDIRVSSAETDKGYAGRELKGVEYEDISRLVEEDA